ncbi:AMP-binding protein [Ilumatobacter sp.]|uniref:AMP-binding protein n=1 Tax=Ilumatobacter sp. TaxID=1967498 RepID=UPI003AF5F694
MVADTVMDLFERSPSALTFDDGTIVGSAAVADEGRRLARSLRDRGLEPGDRIALHLPNGADYVRLLLAAAAGGFVAVSVNTRYSDAEVAALIARSGARTASLDHDWRGSPPVSSLREPDDGFLVFTTSGTTNAPKMVLHTQRSIAVHAVDAAAAFGYGRDDTVLVAMPLCGTFGLTSLTAAVAGGSSVVVTNFQVERTAALIESRGVTAVNGSDDMFHRLMAHGSDLSTIRLGGVARFNTSLDSVVSDAEVRGATLSGLYGMSEVQALFSLRDPGLAADDRIRPGGTLVSPSAEFRVVDDELEVRGPSLMAGYLADGGVGIDDELTAAHLLDGWFRTGDLALAEDSRTFEFLARRGDALRLGGFLVHPLEIESVITGVPGVAAAQVVAVDRPDGARPVAFVIGAADEAEVIDACRRRLALHKAPIRVFTVDEFPTTPSANGTKIQRTRLRELAADLLAGDG